jgi:hypothetical protein
MKKTVTARWGNHAVHLSKPLLEYGGPELIEISFKMELVKPFTVDPLMTIVMLEEIMDLAIPLPLVIGMKPMGRGFSLFVLTSLTHEMKYFYRGGGLLGASVEVQLKEYPTTINLSSLTRALGGVFNKVTGAVSSTTSAVTSAATGVVSTSPLVETTSGALGGAVVGTDANAGALSGALTGVENTAYNAAADKEIPLLIQNWGNPVPANIGIGNVVSEPPSPPAIPAAEVKNIA